jgi:hypothetical protein
MKFNSYNLTSVASAMVAGAVGGVVIGAADSDGKLAVFGNTIPSIPGSAGVCALLLGVVTAFALQD